MDPTIIAGAMGALGQAAAGGPSAASSTQGPIGNYMDGAGWTVSTGKATTTGGATVTKPGDFMPGAGAVGAAGGGGMLSAGYGMGNLNQLLPLLLVGMVVFKVLKK